MENETFLENRKKGVGGTDISVILGYNKYKTQFELWEEKMGLSGPVPETGPMRRGKKMEPIVAEIYTEDTGNRIRIDKEQKVHPKNEILRANLDYEILGHPRGRGILECKTASQNALNSWSDNIPTRYFCQIQWQLGITSYTWADYALLNIDTFELDSMPIYPDNKLIDNMQNEAVSWWEKYIVGQTPPPKEVKDLDLIEQDKGSQILASEDILDKFSSLKSVKEDIKELEADKKEMENDIKKFIGENESLIDIDDKPLATWKSQSRNNFDKSTMLKDHPEFEGKYMKESKFRVLRLK